MQGKNADRILFHSSLLMVVNSSQIPVCAQLHRAEKVSALSLAHLKLS